MQNMKKKHGQIQIHNFYLGLKIYFIYFSIK